MIKRIFIVLSIAALIAAPSFAFAKEGHSGDCASCHTLGDKEASDLLSKLGVVVKSVKQAPVKGFFELQVEKEGRQGLLYLDYSKKNLMQGMVFNLQSMQPVSAHPQPQQKQPVSSVDPKSIPVANSVVMGNPKGSKRLYVFTDPDCPYCRKGHAELIKLEKIAPDVAIYIMPFPLPMHPGAYDKARTLLETKDKELLNKAFDGKDVPKPTKDASKAQIEENIKFAGANGITGTPTMIMPDGKIEVGMRDAETLKSMLEGK